MEDHSSLVASQLRLKRSSPTQKSLASTPAQCSLEKIIEQNKNNRKINERSLLVQFSRSKLVPSKSSKDPNLSAMSLTDFYMSRSQCDATKLKRTYKN